MNNLAAQLKQWAEDVTQEALTPVIQERLGSLSPVALRLEKEIDAFTFRYDSGGKKIAGFLVAPKSRRKKLPVIIFNRGGTQDFGLVLKGDLFTRLAHLAQWGYIVIGSQYPGNCLSEGEDERGGQSDVASVLLLHDLVEILDEADDSKIGMYGESRGGMMTYLCIKEATWIRAALTVGGLADLEHSLERRPELRQVYEKHFGNAESAKKTRSVVEWTGKLNKNTPLCLLHGSADERVSVLDALKLAGKLEDAAHPYALHILMGGDHGLRNVRDERDAIIQGWFSRHLQEEAYG